MPLCQEIYQCRESIPVITQEFQTNIVSYHNSVRNKLNPVSGMRTGQDFQSTCRNDPNRQLHGLHEELYEIALLVQLVGGLHGNRSVCSGTKEG